MQWHLRESYNICRVKRKYNNVGICFPDGRPNWRCDLQCVAWYMIHAPPNWTIM